MGGKKTEGKEPAEQEKLAILNQNNKKKSKQKKGERNYGEKNWEGAGKETTCLRLKKKKNLRWGRKKNIWIKRGAEVWKYFARTIRCESGKKTSGLGIKNLSSIIEGTEKGGGK